MCCTSTNRLRWVAKILHGMFVNVTCKLSWEYEIIFSLDVLIAYERNDQAYSWSSAWRLGLSTRLDNFQISTSISKASLCISPQHPTRISLPASNICMDSIRPFSLSYNKAPCLVKGRARRMIHASEVAILVPI